MSAVEATSNTEAVKRSKKDKKELKEKKEKEKEKEKEKPLEDKDKEKVVVAAPKLALPVPPLRRMRHESNPQFEARRVRYERHVHETNPDRAETLSMVWSNMTFFGNRYPPDIEAQLKHWLPYDGPKYESSGVSLDELRATMDKMLLRYPDDDNDNDKDSNSKRQHQAKSAKSSVDDRVPQPHSGA